MKVLIGGMDENLKVTSHILESDPLEPDMFHLFHCWACGKPLMQFGGEEVMSVPGGVKSYLPIIVMCRNCKRRHLFSSIV